MRKLRWLYVDFNSYFASVEQQIDPFLRNKPIAVVPVMTDSTCAIAASYEAKAFGIKTGTPIFEAKKLCKDIICVPARHEAYVEYHNKLCDEINNHIPITAVCSIDEMASRLMDNETGLDKALSIASSIKAGISKNVGEYIKCSIGISTNKYLAKVATDIQKPDGLTVIQHDEIYEKLSHLSLQDFPGIGRNMQLRLYKAGIYDFNSLWKLDPKHMRKIWGGVWGERMWYLMRGHEIPDPETERSTVGHSHILAPNLRPAKEALTVAKRLVTKAASRLRRYGFYASKMFLSIRLESAERRFIELSCINSQDNFTFLNMLDEGWQKLVQDPTKTRIKKISVTLYNLTESNHIQPELFDPLPEPVMKVRKRNEKVSHTMDELNQRFGKDTITIGMLPSAGKGFTGTKIAFSRIPESEEFKE